MTLLTFCCLDVSTLSDYHYPSEEADAASTVSVRHHVSITNGQESDRDHPQSLHVVATEVSVVVVSAGIKINLI